MFTIPESAVGAVLLYLATTGFLEEAGKTVGLSSLIANSVYKPSVYSVTITAGLLLSTVLTYFVFPELLPAPATDVRLRALGGLLVGIGTKWGCGCTSGHMLCGLSLLRTRSLVATLIFCSTAALVVNYFDLAPSCGGVECWRSGRVYSNSKLVGIVAGAYLLSQIRRGRKFSGLKTGLLFGMGLYVSGMADPRKPQGFLALSLTKFDPSLIMIVLFAILPNVLTWRRILKEQPRPLNESAYDLPTATGTSFKFDLGNALFGIGWGLCGMCPGPGLITAPLSTANFAWLAMFLIGRLF